MELSWTFSRVMDKNESPLYIQIKTMWTAAQYRCRSASTSTEDSTQARNLCEFHRITDE